MLVHTDLNAFSDTFHGFNSRNGAAVVHHSNYQPWLKDESLPKEPSGSRACDPISILDDDEPEAAEVSYIDLKDYNEECTKGKHTAPIKQGVAGTYKLGFQSPAERNTPQGQDRGCDTPRLTGSATQPLIQALTQDDLLASSAQPLQNSQAVGFKAWYNNNDTRFTAKATSPRQQREIRPTPSISLCNKERTKKAARADRDAPQFAMSVLKSNRKRTMGQLCYNELVSPAQVESPSEKMARMAKKRRQRQERCDIRPQDTNAGNAQSAPDLEDVYDRENDRRSRVNVNLPVLTIANEVLDSPKVVARTSDERKGSTVVCETACISTHALPTDQRQHNLTQDREGHGDDHVQAYRIPSTEITTQGHDAKEHDDSNNIAYPKVSISRKPSYRKPRVGGPTKAGGVFSPEKKAPVKRSSKGDFHCPRCDSQYTRRKGVNYHFEKCIATYGNPRSLRWNDHPSLGRVEKGIVPIDKDELTIQKDSTCFTHDVESMDRPATTINRVTPLPASNIHTTGLSSLPETRSLTEEQTLCSDNDNELDHQTLGVERCMTSGKGLSAETLKSFQETGNWNCDIDPNEDVDEGQDEETEIPDIAYRYSVLKREWLETEEDAVESSIGPYYTLSEANSVARAEVQCPQIDGFEGIESKGWSYLYREDERGMQMHKATVLGISIETAVHRGKWFLN